MATLVTLVDGSIPVAADFNSNYTALNAEIRPPGTGGTGISTYTTGDIIYASAANTLSRLAAGSTSQVLTMVAGVPAWSGSTPFSAEFISSDQTVTFTSKVSLAHGLGAKPKLVQLSLKNTTTELNYSVGDEVTLTPIPAA